MVRAVEAQVDLDDGRARAAGDDARADDRHAAAVEDAVDGDAGRRPQDLGEAVEHVGRGAPGLGRRDPPAARGPFRDGKKNARGTRTRAPVDDDEVEVRVAAREAVRARPEDLDGDVGAAGERAVDGARRDGDRGVARRGRGRERGDLVAPEPPQLRAERVERRVDVAADLCPGNPFNFAST